MKRGGGWGGFFPPMFLLEFYNHTFHRSIEKVALEIGVEL